MNWQLEVKLSSLTILGHCLLGRRDSRSGFMRTVVHTWLHCNRFKSFGRAELTCDWLICSISYASCWKSFMFGGYHVWRAASLMFSCLVDTISEELFLMVDTIVTSLRWVPSVTSRVHCLHVRWLPCLKDCKFDVFMSGGYHVWRIDSIGCHV